MKNVQSMYRRMKRLNESTSHDKKVFEDLISTEIGPRRARALMRMPLVTSKHYVEFLQAVVDESTTARFGLGENDEAELLRDNFYEEAKFLGLERMSQDVAVETMVDFLEKFYSELGEVEVIFESGRLTKRRSRMRQLDELTNRLTESENVTIDLAWDPDLGVWYDSRDDGLVIRHAKKMGVTAEVYDYDRDRSARVTGSKSDLYKFLKHSDYFGYSYREIRDLFPELLESAPNLSSITNETNK